MSVTDNQLVIDSSLPLDAAPLVKPGMQVAIDEQALGVKATGVVAEGGRARPARAGSTDTTSISRSASTETPTRLEGFSLRLTIPDQIDQGVPSPPCRSAHCRSPPTERRESRCRRMARSSTSWSSRDSSADGYVEVTPVQGTLSAWPARGGRIQELRTTGNQGCDNELISAQRLGYSS